jgi:chitin disaccharide deacetylase
MTGHIILCADDYGLTPGVSHTIRMLCAANRISATSALVTRPGWAKDAEALKPLMGEIAVGLHLNFTLGAPVTGVRFNPTGAFPRLKALIASTLTGRLDAAAVAAEIEGQLDLFESGIGAPPDFIDGHEHVHVLPVVRSALLSVLQRRYAGRPLLIRDPSPVRSSPGLKSIVLLSLARNFRRDVKQAGFISNDGFGGITGFTATHAAVAQDFAAAAMLAGWRPLVMCHPGFPDAALARLDPVTQRRQMEFDALMGPCPLAQNAWRPMRSAEGMIAWPTSPLERTA